MSHGSELALILEGGKAAHENHSANLTKQIEQLGFLEMSAIRAPAFAAAIGSSLAVIFYAANYSHLSAGITELAIVLAWFLAAIGFSVIVPGLSRLRQQMHTMALAEQKLDYEPPYVHENARSRQLMQYSQYYKMAMVSAVAASYATLVVGGIAFLEIMR